MTLRFRIFGVSMIVGFLLASYETLELVNGWPVDWTGFVIALGMFPVGLIGTSIMWKREARRSYRAAVRRQRKKEQKSLREELTEARGDVQRQLDILIAGPFNSNTRWQSDYSITELQTALADLNQRIADLGPEDA